MTGDHRRRLHPWRPQALGRLDERPVRPCATIVGPLDTAETPLHRTGAQASAEPRASATTGESSRDSRHSLLASALGLALTIAACGSTSALSEASSSPTEGQSSGGETSDEPSTSNTGTGTGTSTGESGGDPSAAQQVIRGGIIVGLGVADIAIADGVITEIGAIAVTPEEVTIAAEGRWIVPAGIDSHVHLDYLRAPLPMAAGGIAVAVDLAAPMAIFDERRAGEFAPLELLVAGPMLAAPGGYPTQSWGSGGFGLECANTEEAVAAVDDLASRGASLVKISLENGPRLSDETIAAVITRAHERDLRVFAHTLGDADAATAAALGVDGLAHTPLEPLSPATIAAFDGLAVISTLHAFGSGEAAMSNLGALHEVGATILYGTDFGNSVTAGIDPIELMSMMAAGLEPPEVLAALTSTPAAFWGLSHGRVEVGAPASVLLLSGDPTSDALLLATPEAVYLDGVLQDLGFLGGVGIAVEPK